jgi:hypothetical protein
MPKGTALGAVVEEGDDVEGIDTWQRLPEFAHVTTIVEVRLLEYVQHLNPGIRAGFALKA